jgi:hypothetical protein
MLTRTDGNKLVSPTRQSGDRTGGVFAHHLYSFIVTRKSCPSIRILQRHMPTQTRTATKPYHRVSSHYYLPERADLE